MAAKHVFTGVFIPAKIWLNKKINPIHKMILAEIKALQEDTGWCDAGNAHFAEWLNCTPQNVSNHISHLAKMGLLQIKYASESTHEGREIRVNDALYNADLPLQPDCTPPTARLYPPYSQTVTPLQPDCNRNNINTTTTTTTESQNFAKTENTEIVAAQVEPVNLVLQRSEEESKRIAAQFHYERLANIEGYGKRLFDDTFGLVRKMLYANFPMEVEEYQKTVKEFLVFVEACDRSYRNYSDFCSNYLSWFNKRQYAKNMANNKPNNYKSDRYAKPVQATIKRDKVYE